VSALQCGTTASGGDKAHIGALVMLVVAARRENGTRIVPMLSLLDVCNKSKPHFRNVFTTTHKVTGSPSGSKLLPFFLKPFSVLDLIRVPPRPLDFVGVCV
jgi:hypothetical protein